jgi:Na+-transporting NADH:ubiquinone oxidoreductase subunit A
MSDVIRLKKGFDINLVGKAEKKLVETIHPDTVALVPDDFIGMGRPKVLVQEGDLVKAGTPIFLDKAMEEVMFTSPVSGEIVEVKRGEKRKLLEIKILADKQIDYLEFERYTVSQLASLTKEDIMPELLRSGVWVNVIQRPYAIIANPNDKPKAIYISTFDTSPLAPDYDFIFRGQEQFFQAGIDILKKIVSQNCTIYLGINAKAEVSKIFGNVKNVTPKKFEGKHPAGNVGVQIHHTTPINKGEIVWTLNPYGVIQIGKLFLNGEYDASKVIALVGSEVAQPQYYKTYTGANIEKYVKENVKNDHVRYISGNVLTGHKISKNGNLGFYDQQITVLPEGDKPRFFLSDGWLAPTGRLSFHKALGLMSFLNPKKQHVMDTSTNGEERAFVVTGSYEEVLPMDILPMHLIKAILANDYDGMESLGIYEVAEEDFALCEFIDVSKQDLQAIIRKGITMIRES